MKKSAFTLLELLIIIVIVGVITSMTFVSLNGTRAKSRDTKRISDIRQLQSALEMYRNDNVNYPPNGGVVAGQPLVGAINNQTYMKKVPVAPGTNDGSCTSDSYTYSQDNSGSSYHITYCLGGAVQSAGPASCEAVPGQICLAGASGGGGGGGPVCGNGVIEGSEVCDSLLTNPCGANAGYFRDGYVYKPSTSCEVTGPYNCYSAGTCGCNNTCDACLVATGCAGGGGRCLKSDTLVSTNLGLRLISEISINDFVLGYDSHFSRTEFKKVIQVLHRPISYYNNQLYQIKVGDDIIVATFNHRFYTSCGIKTVENLAVGDHVFIGLDKELNKTKISKIDIVSVGIGEVWDLKVEGDNNFFANGVLVMGD